ncbi:hypothetical protein CAOG_04318 [Capsaspora owczarzaki ATCC 30864]|uniref:Hydroxylysine kinase n=1 Tax=Capsaspora owczarzaki (strain ATCC 30864) TaxID=595528 RepID=A0A0D2WR10_CAPO3|nr:hypothetical protein CAOG_04318 [Capsaspora owczarzaki ATCC 30864]KJE93548.1 hypothetical protein CAOG_004318 [Capsaspora owczarzaki ATCC 30864]|eukprot:XP_004348146.1 hypothetical protein CAOG_04318 [Capsaspora owczarzaki ATCC 30864]
MASTVTTPEPATTAAAAAAAVISGDSSSITKPVLSQEQVKHVLATYFGIQAELLKEFPSYDDLNYFVRGVGVVVESASPALAQIENGASHEYVLKINNCGEDRHALDLQNKAMMHLRSLKCPAPPVMPSLVNGGAVMFEINPSTLALEPTTTTESASSPASLPVRLLGFVPGTLLYEIKPHAAHYEAVGRFVATMADAFDTFDHPAATRDFMWDLRHAPRFRKHLELVKLPERHAIAQSILDAFDATVGPLMTEAWANPPALDAETGLRIGIIHGDCNDHNILVAQEPPQVIGIIDFGDVVRSHLVFDVAIAAAYCVLDQSDPVAVAASVLSGYLAKRSLNRTELEVFGLLLCVRLAMSVLMSARKQIMYPDDEYLRVTERPAWAALTWIFSRPGGLAAFSNDVCSRAQQAQV